MHCIYHNFDNINIYKRISYNSRLEDAKQRCLTKGYTPDQFENCLSSYESLDVWCINKNRTKITFVQ